LELFPGHFNTVEDASKQSTAYIFAFVNRHYNTSAVFMPPENMTALLPYFVKTKA